MKIPYPNRCQLLHCVCERERHKVCMQSFSSCYELITGADLLYEDGDDDRNDGNDDDDEDNVMIITVAVNLSLNSLFCTLSCVSRWQ